MRRLPCTLNEIIALLQSGERSFASCCSKDHRYSITPSARASSVTGTARPRVLRSDEVVKVIRKQGMAPVS